MIHDREQQVSTSATVTKLYGPVKAVNNVDLTIEGGVYCCMIGPSGCGKTTLLRMIAGHEIAISGSILIGGEDVTSVRGSATAARR